MSTIRMAKRKAIILHLQPCGDEATDPQAKDVDEEHDEEQQDVHFIFPSSFAE